MIVCQTQPNILTIPSLSSSFTSFPLFPSPFPLFVQVGQILKAAETAATYLALVPGDEVMSDNIRIYTSEYKLQPEDFSAREVNRLLAVCK